MLNTWDRTAVTVIMLGVLNYKQVEPARLTDHVRNSEVPVGSPLAATTDDGGRLLFFNFFLS